MWQCGRAGRVWNGETSFRDRGGAQCPAFRTLLGSCSLSSSCSSPCSPVPTAHPFTQQQSVHFAEPIALRAYSALHAYNFFMLLRPHKTGFTPSPTGTAQGEVQTVLSRCVTYALLEMTATAPAGPVLCTCSGTTPMGGPPPNQGAERSGRAAEEVSRDVLGINT